MTDRQLDQMLRQAANAAQAPEAGSVQAEVLARLHGDDGRARRWRSFVQGMLIAAVCAGLATAVGIGWSQAARDETHRRVESRFGNAAQKSAEKADARPPAMELFQKGVQP